MATVTRVQIFRPALDELLHGRNGPVVLHQANVGRQVAGIARRLAPRSDGPGPHLADNIDSKLVPSGRKGYDVQVTANVPHAMFVVRGTQAHRIEGNPILSFEWHGDRVFFRHVNHPGTRANNFMLQALRQVGLDGREIR